MLMEVFWQPEFGTTVGAAGQTIKLVVLVAVLLNTVTAISPVLAPTGTVVVMVVVVLAVTVAVVPLNVTVLFAATTSKFVPVMVTVVPTGPLEGLKELSYTVEGITYHFATAKNLESFKKNPALYEPQYVWKPY